MNIMIPEMPEFLRRKPGEIRPANPNAKALPLVIGPPRKEESGLNQDPKDSKPKALSDEAIFAKLYNRIEDMIDEGGFDDHVEFSKFLTNISLKASILNRLNEHFSKAFDEFMAHENDDLKEYFEGMPDEEIKSRIQSYKLVLDAIENIFENKKVSKQAKKNKKTKVQTKIKTKGIRYRSLDTDFQIQSVDPTEIIGAKGFLTFNAKNRMLTVYIAKDENGLSVKGASIDGFSDKSFAKKIRKPNDILAELRKLNTAKQVVKFLENIRSKPQVARPRSTGETLLLKKLK